jgi:phosphorylcholine metabolism protein LicD
MIKKHPQLSLKKAKLMEKERIAALTQKNLKPYFEQFIFYD